MLEIVALSYNDHPPVVPIRGEIPPEGGGIGRDAGNAVVLPDPARLVSRRHGLFARGENTITLTNVSDGNPFFVNDVELAPGMQAEISDGDILNIGSYVLCISRRRAERAAGRRAVADDRFDSGHPADAREPISIGVEAPARIFEDPPDPTRAHNGLHDSFDALLRGAAPTTTTTRCADKARASDPSPAPDGFRIPDDFDPFDEMFSASRRAVEADVLYSDGIGLDALGPQLTPLSVAAGDPDLPIPSLTRDPLLDVPALVAQDLVDPLMIFADDANGCGLLEGICAETIVRHAQAGPGSELESASRGSSPAAAGTKAIQPSVRTDTAPVAERQSSISSTPTVGATPRHSPAADAGHEAVASVTELRRAFECGLGMPLPEPARGFSPETLELAGRLLRSTLNAMLALLDARTTVKREVRADVTVIEPKDNNPLKFSPDVEVALGYLFGRKFPGFMAADRAVEDACADLCAHQLGMVAGMRAAMETVIGKFDPQRVEAATARSSRAGRILPSLHKAECWDGYRRRYDVIAESFDDEFHDIYGKAFLRAYDDESRSSEELQRS